MNINKNNCEAFFLDYHEGNLSPQQVADLLLFVEQHPEIREEFESFENFPLDDVSSVEFKDKSSLKKQITLENKEEYFIRSIENALNTAETSLLNNFIKQHPHLFSELELFQKTKLYADNSIIFENKKKLKHITVTIDDLCISSLEGLLTKDENIHLKQQLSENVKIQKELSLYHQTKLIADLSIIFESKEELKRSLSPARSEGKREYDTKDDSEKKVIPFLYYFALAASL